MRKLQKLPELRRKFEIDNYLGRSSKALRHLHSLNAYDELRAYAIKHTLYQDALELYKYQPEQLKDITKIYADYLSEQSQYKDAAIGKICPVMVDQFGCEFQTNSIPAYESLSLYEDAYKCYHLAHRWRESMYCAMMVPLPDEALTAHAHTLISSLTEESRDYVSAAQIYIEHLHDIQAAAKLLCRGSRFADATRLLALHGKQELISEIVDNGLADAMGSTTDLFADCKAQLNAQVPRIRELRVRRAADPLAFFGGDPTAGDGGVDIPDNVSLAPTDASTLAGRSMFTRYTGKTGKTSGSRQTSRTRRREERKRARGKKGTVYEEEYLVNSVRRLIERVNAAVPEAESLIDALLRRGMRERAAAVQKALHEVLTMCAECREEVFELPTLAAQNEVNGEDGGAENVNAQDDAEILRPRGGEAVFMESVLATSGGMKNKGPPVVKDFKKSALLA